MIKRQYSTATDIREDRQQHTIRQVGAIISREAVDYLKQTEPRWWMAWMRPMVQSMEDYLLNLRFIGHFS